MADKVTLTKKELVTLEVGAALIGWGDRDTAHTELREAVESIISARLAALRSQIAAEIDALSIVQAEFSGITNSPTGFSPVPGRHVRDAAARIARGGSDPEGGK